jgi:hypothetical protein
MDGHADAPASRRELEGIRHQVVEHLLDPRRVAVCPDVVEFHDHVVVVQRAGHPQPREVPLHDSREGHGDELRRHLPRLQARQIEEVIEQPRQVLRLPADDGAGADGRVVGRADPIEQTDRTRYRAERVPELVREDRQELVLRATRSFGAGASRFGIVASGVQHGSLMLGLLHEGAVRRPEPCDDTVGGQVDHQPDQVERGRGVE